MRWDRSRDPRHRPGHATGLGSSEPEFWFSARPENDPQNHWIQQPADDDGSESEGSEVDIAEAPLDYPDDVAANPALDVANQAAI